MFVDWWSPQHAEWEALYALRDEATGLKVYGILSHLLFVVFVARAVHHRNWFAAVLIGLCTVVSVMYHVCLATDACLGSTVERMRANDRLTATVQIITGASFFMAFARDFAHAVVPLQLLVVVLAHMARPYSLYPVAVTIVVVALGFVTRALVVESGEGEVSWHRQRLFWPALIGAVVCACIGVAFFIVDVGSSILHSSWHLFAAAALLLALEATHGRKARSQGIVYQ